MNREDGVTKKKVFTEPEQLAERGFLLALLIVVSIFFGYEIAENYWLVERYPEWIDWFHIVRGVGTALIIILFLCWYFFKNQPHQYAREIFLSPLQTQREQQHDLQEKVGEWFTRFRWVVASLLLLVLILLSTLAPQVLWEPNFLALIGLAIFIATINTVYLILKDFGMGHGSQLPYQIGVDFLCITLLLQFTGGVENPAFMLYFIHVIMGGVVLTTQGAWICFGSAFLMFFFLSMGQYTGVLPHYDLIYFHAESSNYFHNANYVTTVLLCFSGVGAAATYLTTLVVESWRHHRHRLLSEKKRTDQLVEKLFRVREEERARLSRELHDQIGQSLSAIRLKIHNKNEEDKVNWAKDIAENLEDSIEEVRELSHQLRPPSLDDCGLPCAIDDYSKEIENYYDVDVDFEFLGIGHAQNLSEALDTAIYRVSQEAIRNAVEHGNSENISVILQKNQNQLQLMVEDDGTGFDPDILRENGRDSLGIQGMNERVQLLDGAFTLESNPGEGTRVRAEIPLSDGEVN